MNDVQTSASEIVPAPEPNAIAPIVGEALVEKAAAVRAEIAKAFIGQDDVLDQILIVLLAGGHVLIEGVPGLGKTLLVRALGLGVVGPMPTLVMSTMRIPSIAPAIMPPRSERVGPAAYADGRSSCRPDSPHRCRVPRRMRPPRDVPIRAAHRCR